MKPNDLTDFEAVKQEILDLSKKCVKCGMCRTGCPIYEVKQDEKFSPRSKNQLYGHFVELNDLSDQELITTLKDMAYRCSLCNNCFVRCPLDINLKILFRNFRNYLVKNGQEVDVHKKMVENVREHGNPFGDPKEMDPKDRFYCC